MSQNGGGAGRTIAPPLFTPLCVRICVRYWCVPFLYISGVGYFLVRYLILFYKYVYARIVLPSLQICIVMLYLCFVQLAAVQSRRQALYSGDESPHEPWTVPIIVLICTIHMYVVHFSCKCISIIHLLRYTFLTYRHSLILGPSCLAHRPHLQVFRFALKIRDVEKRR